MKRMTKLADKLDKAIDIDDEGNVTAGKNIHADGNLESSRFATDNNEDGLPASISYYDMLFFNKLKDMKKPVAYDLEYAQAASARASFLRCCKWEFEKTSLTDRRQTKSSTFIFGITKKAFTHGIVLTSGNDIVTCTLITAGRGKGGDYETSQGEAINMQLFKQVMANRRYSANGVIGGIQIVYIQGESGKVFAYDIAGTSHDLSTFAISDITYVLHYGYYD